MVESESNPGGLPVRQDIKAAQQAALERMVSTGSFWTGPERLTLLEAAREARFQRAIPPSERTTTTLASAPVPEAALDVARTIAADPHRVDRAWFETRVAEIGDAAYVEIVGIVACMAAMDAFCEALGVAVLAFPAPRAGEPDRVRPQGLADIGAFVEMDDPFAGPNVGRALSLAPGERVAFFGLVGSMYAMKDFGELVWDRPLTRPQVELVAARVSALNECFY
jgi:alkylhydroperoxidase family enzyme